MGAEQNKQKMPPVKQLDKQQTILALKMQAKRFAAQAHQAEKEKDALYYKARQQMKKNNEEMAKMFLNQAAMKQSESSCVIMAASNLHRMSVKMDTLAGTIGNSNNHQAMMNAYNKVGYMLAVQQQHAPNLEHMAGNVERFENAMDEILIGNNVANNLLFKNENNANVDHMMDALKSELAL